MGWRDRADLARVAVAPVLVLAGCALGEPSARYTGTLAACGLAAATLVRIDNKFAFSPGDGALTVEGTVAANGGFAGTLNTQPPDKAPFVLSVRGRILGEMATVDYTTPRCRASAQFNLVHPPLL